MPGTDLTNQEIAGLRAYFRRADFKYPAASEADLPDKFFSEGWALIYFNALPRLLEEVLRRRFHAKYNEIDVSEPARCRVQFTGVTGSTFICDEPMGHEGQHYSRGLERPTPGDA